ncbi:hypothetical protein [uncultured Clostridium sp.]|nr:hypothetical protein [uncultured Clostridium sp.]
MSLDELLFEEPGSLEVLDFCALLDFFVVLDFFEELEDFFDDLVLVLA